MTGRSGRRVPVAPPVVTDSGVVTDSATTPHHHGVESTARARRWNGQIAASTAKVNKQLYFIFFYSEVFISCLCHILALRSSHSYYMCKMLSHGSPG